MRILMTQRELVRRGGTELVTIEVAKELAERGHEVAIYSPKVGEISKIAMSSGVRVHERLAEIPWTPDVIHGQHHLQTMAALARFTEAAAIYYCHGFLPWVEQPPVHPRIGRYLMMCEWLVPRAEPEYGIPAEKVVVLPNFVNLTRFSRVRTPPARPARAVLFGGSLPQEDLQSLQSACEECGLTLEKIGYNHDNPLDRPEVFLQDYDLVFALGRCAIEAAACGCAVIPVMPSQAGGLVTTETLAQYEFSNFSPRYFITAEQVSIPWLKDQLTRYHSDEVLKVTALVRGRHSLTFAVDRLLEFYDQALSVTTKDGAGQTRGEFAPYLETLGRDANEIWNESVKAKELSVKVQDLKKALRQSEKQREKLSAQYSELKLRHDLMWQMLRDSVAGRWLLRRVKRLLRHAPTASGEKDEPTDEPQ